MTEDCETYWTNELGETVDLNETPGGFSLYVGGQACYTANTLDEIERWLGIYAMVKGSN